MHSKPLKLSARAPEILWACHIPSELSKGACVERGPFEFDAWARRRGKKKKMLKREGKKKNQKKNIMATSDNEAATHLQVHVCWCGACCFWESGGLTSLSEGAACARMKWQCSRAPRTILRHVRAIRVCLVRRKKCSVQWGRESAVGLQGEDGRGGGRGGAGEMTEWQHDSSSSWHIFHLITPEL